MSQSSDPTDSFAVKLVTNGRHSAMERAGKTMVALTMSGRRSGRQRSVQLTSVVHEGDRLIVASAMGQKKHPGWRYDLEADPDVAVQVVGERYRARAELLDDAEKDVTWDKMKTQIPMIHVYEKRIDRNIRVFRIRRHDSAGPNARANLAKGNAPA